MKFPKIHIETNGAISTITINGQEIDGVRAFELTHSHCANSQEWLPILRLDIIATDVTVDALVVPELPEVFKPFYVRRDLGADETSEQSDPEQDM